MSYSDGAAGQASPGTIPIFLLKTKSSPADSYGELFSSVRHEGRGFEPRFVPVLEHGPDPDGIARVIRLLRARRIGKEPGYSYGGLVFTSQRAVEAFTDILQNNGEDEGWPYLRDIPVYSVGPATTRALNAALKNLPLAIVGDHTGNGENLARFIQEHYAEWYRDQPERPPLLFLVGEKRSDSIPKILMDERLPQNQRIRVDEIVVYKTGVLGSFKDDFDAALNATFDSPMRWVVVFSPSGCDSMLRGLDLLDERTGKSKADISFRKTRIATIGPTTRNYLRTTFNFEPDVCASSPTPEGLWNSIVEYMKQ
ncbi:hypothetical protein VTK73DRAFT_3917 [Phialemonium thermophilum]|uniref:Tetrapyrrole biosynthesis uroporphyrinogen III synthase domain-containing protein n=1 Tax=Phialemonium thermophilum TaxID=223376 RepID=A0ABR3WWL6_9PEZI